MRSGYISRMVAFALIGALLGGCTPQTGNGGQAASSVGFQAASPLVGSWSGQSKLAPSDGLAGLATAALGDQVVGPCTLTLQADGSGYLKVAKLPERPINWKQDGSRLILTHVSGMAARSDKNKDEDTAVAHLAADNRGMTLDLGQLTVNFTRDTAH